MFSIVLLFILYQTIWITSFIMVYIPLFYKTRKNDISLQNSNVLSEERPTFELFEIQKTISCSTECKNLRKQLWNAISLLQDTNDKTNIAFFGVHKKQDHKNIQTHIEEILVAMLQLFKKHDRYVIFFQKPNLMGKMYFISIPTHKKIIQLSKIQNPYKINTENTNESQHYHIQNNQFIKDFKFIYGRHFSCYVPPGIRIRIIGPQENQNILLNEGLHSNIFYYQPSFIKMEIDRVSNKKLGIL